ncbi:uncharacterized protein LOC131027715 [Cryptomeria japonica]|uniref:uncharacterized protein LOC131027715 n=1 Tax=Cryptomeria japonica TaxID=3369 RepID=UPI0025AC5B3F|nr:uncharacterized protein LOC131027715 [Cryptomeria japonica]
MASFFAGPSISPNYSLNARVGHIRNPLLYFYACVASFLLTSVFQIHGMLFCRQPRYDTNCVVYRMRRNFKNLKVYVFSKVEEPKEVWGGCAKNKHMRDKFLKDVNRLKFQCLAHLCGLEAMASTMKLRRMSQVLLISYNKFPRLMLNTLSETKIN